MTDQIEAIKREAKRLSRATSITHMQALDVLAVQRGYDRWGTMAASLGRAPAPTTAPLPHPPGDIPDIRSMLERAFGLRLDRLHGCRHLIVSGRTSTGKTTLLGTLLKEVPAGARIASVEDTREIDLPERARVLTFSRTATPPMDRHVIEDAVADRPHLLVVGEISTSNALYVLDVMTRRGGPAVATTIHARDALEAAETFARRVAHMGGGNLPDEVAVVHVDRGLDGQRRITEVVRMQ